MKRKYTTIRCPRCHVAQSHCVCSIEPSLESGHEFNLLIHSEEFKKPTNTSFLAGNVMEAFSTHVWYRTEAPKKLLEDIQNTKKESLVIFPSQNSIPLESYLEKSPEGPKQLILLDGTWKQARKIYNLSPYLNTLPTCSISPKGRTEYLLRRQKKDYGLSTLESIVEVLRILGEVETARKLRAYFRVFQWAYIQAKLNFINNMDLPSMYQEMLLSDKPNWDELLAFKSS